MQDAITYGWVDHDPAKVSPFSGPPSESNQLAWDGINRWVDHYIGFPYNKLPAVGKSLNSNEYVRSPKHPDGPALAFPEGGYRKQKPRASKF